MSRPIEIANVSSGNRRTLPALHGSSFSSRSELDNNTNSKISRRLRELVCQRMGENPLRLRQSFHETISNDSYGNSEKLVFRLIVWLIY